jgi:hypothetical protein
MLIVVFFTEEEKQNYSEFVDVGFENLRMCGVGNFIVNVIKSVC